MVQADLGHVGQDGHPWKTTQCRSCHCGAEAIDLGISLKFSEDARAVRINEIVGCDVRMDTIFRMISKA